MENTAPISANSYDYASLINAAETEASRGCGQSYELYEKLVQNAYASILAKAPDAKRSATEAALKERGFEPDFTPYQTQDDECSLTGIDENCCPCGQHP